MGYTAADVDLQCRIMINFYNYLMVHNVCPEYTNQIMAARRVCERAKYELPTITVFQEQNRGFSLACSVLFGGHYAQSDGHNINDWDDSVAAKDRLPIEKARIIILAAISAMGSDDMFEAVLPQGEELKNGLSKLKYTKQEHLDLEVVGIEKPTTETENLYAAENKTQSKITLKPLGQLVCKPWKKNMGPAYYDLPKGVTFHPTPSQGTYTFWLEGETLEHAFKGMKLSASIRYLTAEGCDGVWVLDAVSKVYCSFYTWILNELMEKPYKAPRELSFEEVQNEEVNGQFPVTGGNGEDGEEAGTTKGDNG
jgi:hypothetical protein